MDGKIDKEMDRFIAGQKRGLLIHQLGQKNKLRKVPNEISILTTFII